MIKCPNCGHENPEHAKVCDQCGTALRSGDTTIAMPPHAEETGKAGTILPVEGAVAELVVAKGPGVGQRFSLGRDEISVGRDPDSDIFLNDITVSRRHARIAKSDDDFSIADVGSLNGTYLNGERIDESELRHGDELWIGKYKLIFVRGT